MTARLGQELPNRTRDNMVRLIPKCFSNYASNTSTIDNSTLSGNCICDSRHRWLVTHGNPSSMGIRLRNNSSVTWPLTARLRRCLMERLTKVEVILPTVPSVRMLIRLCSSRAREHRWQHLIGDPKNLWRLLTRDLGWTFCCEDHVPFSYMATYRQIGS